MPLLENDWKYFCQSTPKWQATRESNKLEHIHTMGKESIKVFGYCASAIALKAVSMFAGVAALAAQ